MTADTAPEITFSMVQSVQELRDKYHQIQPLLQKALTEAPEYTEDAIILKIINSTSQLWLAEQGDTVLGVTVTNGVQYPNLKALNIHLIGGSRIKEWMQMGLEAIENFAKDTQCTEVRLSGRHGWIKMLKDYERTRVTLTKRL
jgi:hypothetical protein